MQTTLDMSLLLPLHGCSMARISKVCICYTTYVLLIIKQGGNSIYTEFLCSWKTPSFLNLLENSWKSDPPGKFSGILRVLKKTGIYKYNLTQETGIYKYNLTQETGVYKYNLTHMNIIYI